MRRYELSDFKLGVIQPHLPNKVRRVARVDDRTTSCGASEPARHGRCAGSLWSLYDMLQPVRAMAQSRGLGLLAEVPKAFDGEIIIIDSSCVRVHQHAATAKRGAMTMVAWDVPAAASPPRFMRLSMPKGGQSISS